MYYCFHVVRSALWSRMWTKLVPQKSTLGHLKIGQSIRCAVAAASRKTTEKNEMWSVRKQPTEICGQKQPKPRGQAMWSKAFESMEAISHFKGFFLPPVSYCNLEKQVCQVLKITFSLPIILGAINKEKGSARNFSRSHKCLEEGAIL